MIYSALVVAHSAAAHKEEINMIKIRITAKEDNCKKYCVVFMGEKVAVAFSRDSGAKVAYSARMIGGEIGSGGSRANWYCIVRAGSIFELEIDEEIFHKNKNRIKKWDMEVIEDFSMSKERAEKILKAEQNLE
jgi:hypothetical protein